MPMRIGSSFLASLVPASVVVAIGLLLDWSDGAIGTGIILAGLLGLISYERLRRHSSGPPRTSKRGARGASPAA